MIEILLGIVVLCEITRIITMFKPQNKKNHYRQKLEGTEKLIWDLEFKLFKTQEVREDIRKEYDTQKSRLASIEETIKNWKGDKAEKARHEDTKVLVERDIQRFEAQMKQLDIEMYGSTKTNEYPDGAKGIKDDIDSLRELTGMLKDWIIKV